MAPKNLYSRDDNGIRQLFIVVDNLLTFAAPFFQQKKTYPGSITLTVLSSHICVLETYLHSTVLAAQLSHLPFIFDLHRLLNRMEVIVLPTP